MHPGFTCCPVEPILPVFWLTAFGGSQWRARAGFAPDLPGRGRHERIAYCRAGDLPGQVRRRRQTTRKDSKIPAALIGPRRVRQGLGGWLAGFAEEAGAEILRCLGKDPDRIASSAKALSGKLGHPVLPCRDLDELLAESPPPRPELLIVASPPEAHEEALVSALDRGLHVFCEKPLLEGVPGDGEKAARLVDAFAARRLTLGVNTQWPFTLEAWFRLFPDQRGREVRDFRMLLSPASASPRSQVRDSLPHVLSLLQALAPGVGAMVRAPRFHAEGRDSSVLCFDWVGPSRVLGCEVRLERVAKPPRPAGYGWNGRFAERRIRLPSYEMSFTAEGREVPYEDPTRACVRAFMDRLLRREPGKPEPGLAERMAMLETLLRHVPRSPGFLDGHEHRNPSRRRRDP